MSVGTGELVRLLSGRLPRKPEALAALRDRRLRALVRSAYERVPYYRALFDDAGLGPRDVRSADDLRHLPVSTRDALRAAGEGARARGVDWSATRVVHTSGSSGKPWAVHRTRAEDRLRRAVEFRSMRHTGIRPTDVIALLGAVRNAPRRPLERCGLFRVIEVSPLLPVERQIERLREIRPSVFWVYPTALRALLAAAESLEAVIEPRMVVTSAEPLDEPLRRRAFDRRPIETRNFYGSAEIGRIGWECGEHRGLHVNVDCVILELLEDDDLPGAGRSVVATNLNSHAMPFLRYRLGDRCAWVEGGCPCGSPLPLIRPPVGREWDVLRLPSGRMVSPWGLNVFLRDLPGLLQFRFVQKRRDRLEVQLRFSRPPASATLESLRERIASHLGEPISIEIAPVDAIGEGTLKFRSFLSELERED